MTDDASAAGISEVGTVFVPVSDQDRSLEFFVGKLGFEKRAESVHAALRARRVDVDAEISRAGTPRSGLVSTAVSVEDPVPPQFFVRDPDGNRFLIVQAG